MHESTNARIAKFSITAARKFTGKHNIYEYYEYVLKFGKNFKFTGIGFKRPS